MTLDQQSRDGVEIIRITGQLDSATSPELERLVLERLEGECQRMVFDLADMDYVSSAGLRVILLAGKKLRTRKGQLVLAGLREAVRDVFEMSGFLALFTVTRNVQEALTQA
jgi:anti-sigma B factor antagonist/stage II sporulation protein AA (anti-sigma F factor antagonist)